MRQKMIGVTVGKFMPFHKGHEYMIEFASTMLDHLTVLVSGRESDSISVEKRFDWVRTFVKEEGLKNVEVIYHIDKSPTPINVDENGTVRDIDFQYYWANEFTRHCNGLTHVVSSDLYGGVLAKTMRLQWLPVDPKREVVPISATEIRENLNENFKYISDYAKPYFRKKIVVVGPESTGKSTMTKMLAGHFNGSFSPEYGRTISEARGFDLTKQDFLDIYFGQCVQDRLAKKSDKRFLFVDTEAYTTFLFGQLYLNRDFYYMKWFAAKEKTVDLYILLKPNVDFVQDGNRILEEQEKRETFYEDMLKFLVDNSKPFVVILEKDYDKRFELTVQMIERSFQ